MDACASSNQSHPLWPMCVENREINQVRLEHRLSLCRKGLYQPMIPLGGSLVPLEHLPVPDYALRVRLPGACRESFMSKNLKAIYEDGVNTTRALAWNFMDNWEFGHFSLQYGLQKVNRTTQQR